jgi:diacylglycerol kinase family enzyme
VAIGTAAAALTCLTTYIVLSPIATVVSVLTLSAGMICGWQAAARRRHRGAWALGALLALAATLVLLLDNRRDAALAALSMTLAVASVVAARMALHHEVAVQPVSRLVRVPPSAQPTLLVNHRSGNGTAARTGLVEAARAKGVDVLVLTADDDLRILAERAIAQGADALGMAGGDGSQAVVAGVAAQRQVPMVCIPSGTRNHFALDLGVDPTDPVHALQAFDEAYTYAVDLGVITDGRGIKRPFVNNVVMGIYGRAVHSEGYRAAKRETVLEVCERFAGPAAFDLRFDGPDGTPHPAPDLLFVGNNRYRLTSAAGFGRRPRLDEGHLNIVSVRIDDPTELAKLAALELAGRPQRFNGWAEWTTPEFRVDAEGPIEAGVDGEAVLLTPPVTFAVTRRAVRVRVPPASSPWATKGIRRFIAPLKALTRVARGRGAGARV